MENPKDKKSQKAGQPEEGEIVKCKIFGVCRPDICPGYVELDDWQGCALELGEMAVKEGLRDGARSLDQLMEMLKFFLGPRR